MKSEGWLPRSQEPATAQCHVILPSTPRSLKWSLSSRFFDKKLYAFLISVTRATSSVHLIGLDLITVMKFSEEYNLWSSSLCHFCYPSIVSSLLGPNICTQISSLYLCGILWPKCFNWIYSQKFTGFFFFWRHSLYGSSVSSVIEVFHIIFQSCGGRKVLRKISAKTLLTIRS
jgi:hypothetical protein